MTGQKRYKMKCPHSAPYKNTPNIWKALLWEGEGEGGGALYNKFVDYVVV